jgi:hypothetical protein
MGLPRLDGIDNEFSGYFEFPQPAFFVRHNDVVKVFPGLGGADLAMLLFQ